MSFCVNAWKKLSWPFVSLLGTARIHVQFRLGEGGGGSRWVQEPPARFVDGGHHVDRCRSRSVVADRDRFRRRDICRCVSYPEIALSRHVLGAGRYGSGQHQDERVVIDSPSSPKQICESYQNLKKTLKIKTINVNL